MHSTSLKELSQLMNLCGIHICCSATEGFGHYLNEAKSAVDKLHRNSLILLDDKNLKTTQSLEFLLANKFNILICFTF